jgi:hypothetical protein
MPGTPASYLQPQLPNPPLLYVEGQVQVVQPIWPKLHILQHSLACKVSRKSPLTFVL